MDQKVFLESYQNNNLLMDQKVFLESYQNNNLLMDQKVFLESYQNKLLEDESKKKFLVDGSNNCCYKNSVV